MGLKGAGMRPSSAAFRKAFRLVKLISLFCALLAGYMHQLNYGTLSLAIRNIPFLDRFRN